MKDLIKPLTMMTAFNSSGEYIGETGLEEEIRELEHNYREAIQALVKINKSVVEHRTEDGYQDVILVMEGIEIENMLERQTGKSWAELQEERE